MKNAQATARKVESTTNDNPLRSIMQNPESGRRTRFKVGNLYYQYISNTSLAERRDITGEHIADILKERGYVDTAVQYGNTVYWWVKPAPSRAEFFRDILGMGNTAPTN